MGEIRRDDLDRIGRLQPGTACLHRSGGGGANRGHHRHPEQREQHFGLRFGQDQAIIGAHRRDQRLCLGQACRGNLGGCRQGLAGRGLAGGGLHQTGKGANGLVGRLEQGNAGIGEIGGGGMGVGIAQPAGQHGLGRMAGGNRSGHGARHLAAIGQRGRAVHHQQRIDIGISQHRFHRAAIAAGPRIADNVHRIGPRPAGRQQTIQGGDGRGGKRGQPPWQP